MKPLRQGRLWLRYAPLAALLGGAGLPLVVLLLTSVKTAASLLRFGPFAWSGWSSANYQQVLASSFPRYLATSALVACASTLLAVAAGAAAAYALARWQFAARRSVATAFLLTRLMPPTALALPVFLLLGKLQLIDTVWGLVLAHTSFNLPFAVWLLLPLFAALPKEYEEAAAIDGCTPWATFRLIMLPLALPGIATAAVFCFLASWNDFLFSLVLAGGKTKTAALAVNGYLTGFSPEWGAMTAASVLMLAPALTLSYALQQHLLAGLTAGGVKQ